MVSEIMACQDPLNMYKKKYTENSVCVFFSNWIYSEYKPAMVVKKTDSIDFSLSAVHCFLDLSNDHFISEVISNCPALIVHLKDMTVTLILTIKTHSMRTYVLGLLLMLRYLETFCDISRKRVINIRTNARYPIV